MTGDTKRRVLLTICMMVSFLFLSCSQEDKPVTRDLTASTLLADCPPADGYDWKPWARKPSPYVMWAQSTSERQFVNLCESTTATACMLIFQEVNVVVGRSPRYVYSEGFQRHEECHAWGYHGPPPIGGLYR